MKIKSLILIVFACYILCINCKQTTNEDEFAEFEFEDESAVKSSAKISSPAKENKKGVDEEILPFDYENMNYADTDTLNQKQNDNKQKPLFEKKGKDNTKTKQKFNEDSLDSEEFESFIDEEEFEGFDQPQSTDVYSETNKQQSNEPDLKITAVPSHLLNTNSWSHYYLEIILFIGLFVYILNIFFGKQKNYQLANSYFYSHRDILEKNFVLIGDDGTSVDLPKECTLIKECENVYGIWCSGRQSCKSMYIQMKLLKRQDLISQIKYLFKKQSDQLIFNIEFERDDVDSYVFCLANRKLISNLQHDYQDLANYCVEKKNVDKFGLDSAKYIMLNELSELPPLILDTRVCAFLNKYTDLLEYLIVSDQHIGIKSTLETNDDQANPQLNNSNETDFGLPNAKSNMTLCFNIPGKGNTSVENIDKMQPTLLLVFYLIDKICRLRVSKETKQKAIKKRKDVLENYLKITNKQRQEAAQLRKEEKRRADKERILNESDPEKQKRLEEKELKREKRKQQQKFKQIKIKSM